MFKDWELEVWRLTAMQNANRQVGQTILDTINRLEDFKSSLFQPESPKTATKDCLVSLVNLEFNDGGYMRNIKILATNGYTSSILIPAIKRMRAVNNNFLFEIKEATVDYMPDDVDFRFFQFNNPSENYIEETILETELNLYASPEYLNIYGEPRKLEDMNQHTTILPQKANVLRKVGNIKYLPINYNRESLKVDSLTSLVAMGEEGLGIICLTDKTVGLEKLKLERIKKLADTQKVPFVFSTHKSIKDDPIAQQFGAAIRAVLS